MPPRIPSSFLPTLRISPSSFITPPSRLSLLPSICVHPHPHHSSRPFHTTPPTLSGGPRTLEKRRDRYAAARAKVRKEKNLTRQAELRAERDASSCDPVLGHPTDFIKETLDHLPAPLPSNNAHIFQGAPDSDPSQQRFNHFLTASSLETYLTTSKRLSYPLTHRAYEPDPSAVSRQDIDHIHATEAVRRIVSLSNGSSKDRLRENKQRVISVFGRHVTDHTLPPDPVPAQFRNTPKPFEKTPRAGPDTGSSEVQAAILTAKIRALAEHVDKFKKDKMNKRNLRLLVHKRQKILRYLKKKEKGGIRYRNLMDKLGLDDRAIEEELFL